MPGVLRLEMPSRFVCVEKFLLTFLRTKKIVYTLILNFDSVFFGKVSVACFVFDHNSRGLFGYPGVLASLIDCLKKTIHKVD